MEINNPYRAKQFSNNLSLQALYTPFLFILLDFLHLLTTLNFWFKKNTSKVNLGKMLLDSTFLSVL